MFKKIIAWLYKKFVKKIYLPPATKATMWLKHNNGVGGVSVITKIPENADEVDYIRIWSFNGGFSEEIISNKD